MANTVNWHPAEGMRYYNGNKNLKKAGERIDWTPEMIREWAKCASDIYYFLENYMTIITLDDGLVTIKLRDYQKKIIDNIINNKNTIICTSRQAGKTTTLAGIILHYILFQSYKTVAILGNKEKAAKETYKRMQTAYEHLPKWLQQGALTWNKMDLKLENGSEVSVHATSADGTRGMSANFVYIDEASRIEQWEEFSMSVLPTVSSGKTTKIVMTSTPNGLNYFYDYFENAKKPIDQGGNGWAWQEVMWYDVPGRDEAWRLNAMAELNNDPDKFAQEHCCQFMGSSGTLISGWKLKELLKNITLPVYKEANFHQFESPIKGIEYVLIADVSAGKGLDYSAFHIISVSNLPYKQVATFKDNLISPMDYVSIMHMTAKHFNNAYILVETNNMGVEIVNRLWDDFEYENIFYTVASGRAGKKLAGGGEAKDRGIITSKPIRDIGCSMLKLLVESNKLVLNDLRSVSELTTFSKKHNHSIKYEAEEGKTDDLVMGLVLFGWMTNQTLFKNISTTSVFQQMRDVSQQQLEKTLLPIGMVDDGRDEHVEVKMDDGIWHSSNF